MESLPPFPVVVAANFTAEPIRDVLAYWLRLLDLDARVSFAPYDQVMQQVLDPASQVATNAGGANVLLVRPYGFNESPDEDGRPASERARLAVEAADQLAQAIDARARATGGLWIVGCCPPPPAVREMDGEGVWESLERCYVDGLAETPGTYVIRGADVLTRYEIADYHDEHGRHAGDIPYTTAFYAALATAVARAVHAMVTVPRKAIVLDCDHTLWSGVCGEEGAGAVTIDESRRYLQQFFVEQMRRGVLLCLCSKNEEADVWRVFDERSDMTLRREHLVAWRINWKRKSENIRALADDLQIGADTFIFVDDDPVECAEVQARLPDVITMQLPPRVEAIPAWLERQWVFDRWRVTAEDRERTQQYLLRAQRDSHRAQATTIDDFVRMLDVRVTIRPAAKTQLARIGQLTYRTTQFNFTLKQRSELELRRIHDSDDHLVLAVEASDRYGDYGLIGAMVLCGHRRELEVDTFLLSCRALGRNIEQQMVREVETIARQRGYERARIRFVPGSRNMVARTFLDALRPAWRRRSSADACEYVMRVCQPQQVAACVNE